MRLAQIGDFGQRPSAVVLVDAEASAMRSSFLFMFDWVVAITLNCAVDTPHAIATAKKPAVSGQ
jgi:hypothetical protein